MVTATEEILEALRARAAQEGMGPRSQGNQKGRLEPWSREGVADPSFLEGPSSWRKRFTPFISNQG